MLEREIISDVRRHHGRSRSCACVRGGFGANRSLRLISAALRSRTALRTLCACLRIGCIARSLRGILLLPLFLACARSAWIRLCGAISGGDCGSGSAGYISAFLVIPGRDIVLRSLRIETGVQPVFGKLESLLNNEGSVGVIKDVILRDPIILERIVDHAAQKRNVSPRAYLQEHVCN